MNSAENTSKQQEGFQFCHSSLKLEQLKKIHISVIKLGNHRRKNNNIHMHGVYMCVQRGSP